MTPCAICHEEGVVVKISEIVYREEEWHGSDYIGGHHAQYAVYDGSQMICLCVYKKGALNAMDYILKLKGDLIRW